MDGSETTFILRPGLFSGAMLVDRGVFHKTPIQILYPFTILK